MSGKSELRLFDKPLPQIAVESGAFVDINPTTSLSENASTIDFVIRGSEGEYLDLNDTFLYVNLNVLSSDNKPLSATSVVTPSNYFMNSLFQDVILKFNDTIVEGGSRLFPYKATIEDIFHFDHDAKMFQLYMKGYWDGEEERKRWIGGGEDCELVGALRLDFFNQPTNLVPGVDVTVTLHRAKNTFSLNKATKGIKLNIKDVKLYVRRIKANPSVSLAHEVGLKKGNAKYNYNRGQVITYAIPAQSQSHFKDNLFSRSLLPKFVVVGFVSSSSMNGDEGDTGSDPFKFNHFNISSVGLYRDGQSVPFRDLYEPNFERRLCARDYFKAIIHNPQHFNTNFSNGVKYDQFRKGEYTLFTFNLTPDYDFSHLQQPRDANLRLEVKFSKPLPESINAVVYGVFDTELQITKDRQIILDNVH